MNCLVDLMPYASQTRVSRPQKNWAMVEPSSTAGVSEKMVSVATASLRLVTRFYRCLGYVLVVLNLSIPKIIIS